MTAAPAQSVLSANATPRPVPVLDFSHEFRVLLACCRGFTNPGQDRSFQTIISGPIDWGAVLAMAEHHGVLSQVYRCLSAVAGARPELGPIRQRYEAGARQALWLSRELLRILDHLDSLGIHTLPHKGPVLAELLYGSVVMRQFSDIDLIVRTADIPRIKTALIGLGYEQGIQLTPRERRAYLSSGYEYTFDSPHGRNLLEIQWQVLPRFYSIDFDVDGFFNRAQTVKVAGRSLKTLSAEDTLLVLCVHAAKHAWVQLSWLCDIAALVRSPIDWKMVQSEAKRMGIGRIVAVNCFLIRELLGVELAWGNHFEDNHFEDDQFEVETQALGRTILPIIAHNADYNTESVPYFRLMMRLRERRRDRARFLWRLLSTPGVGEWSAVRLPALLFPLYRGVRVFRLMRRL